MKPLFEALKQELLSNELLHADETIASRIGLALEEVKSLRRE